VRSRSLLWSFDYAIRGVIYTLRTQRNMRIHVAAAALVLIASVVLGVGRRGLVSIVFAISFVFVAELINTAIEATVDLAIDRYDPSAKIAKDVAAGAVLVASLNALVVAYLVLFDPVRHVAQEGLNWVRATPADLTVVAFGLTLLAVLALKAARKEGSLLRGGWPSGHTALAFGIAMALAYITHSASVLVLALFLAGLVGQSRVEGGIHSVPQVLLGALLGVLLTTAVFQLFFW
jgi:diacylglycerol kinase (ATP)